jgi:hypothetical protein
LLHKQVLGFLPTVLAGPVLPLVKSVALAGLHQSVVAEGASLFDALIQMHSFVTSHTQEDEVPVLVAHGGWLHHLHILRKNLKVHKSERLPLRRGGHH